MADELSATQYAAIAALLTEKTVDAAAKKVNTSARTVYRWLDDDAFKAEFRAARRAMVDQAVVVLQQATKEAVAALRRNLKKPAPAGVQVQAAKEILDKAVNAQSLIELQAEVKELRAAMGKQNADAGVRPPGPGQTQGGDAGPDPARVK